MNRRPFSPPWGARRTCGMHCGHKLAHNPVDSARGLWSLGLGCAAAAEPRAAAATPRRRHVSHKLRRALPCPLARGAHDVAVRCAHQNPHLYTQSEQQPRHPKCCPRAHIAHIRRKLPLLPSAPWPANNALCCIKGKASAKPPWACLESNTLRRIATPRAIDARIR